MTEKFSGGPKDKKANIDFSSTPESERVYMFDPAVGKTSFWVHRSLLGTKIAFTENGKYCDFGRVEEGGGETNLALLNALETGLITPDGKRTKKPLENEHRQKTIQAINAAVADHAAEMEYYRKENNNGKDEEDENGNGRFKRGRD